MKSLFTPKRIFLVYFRFSNSFLKRTMSVLPMAFVRHVDGEETMKISFTYGNNTFPNRDFTFLRSVDENIEISLFRIKFKIQNAIVQKSSKKKKKKSNAEEPEKDAGLPPLDVCVMQNDEVIDITVKNLNAWSSGNQLKICDQLYEIFKNPPSVTEIALPKNIMLGFPVYPKITLDFCTKENCKFTWYRFLTKAEKQTLTDKNLEILNQKGENWLKLSDGYFYVPTADDIGHKLRVSCLPHNENIVGKSEAAISINSVEPGPGKCPFEDRHNFTNFFTETGSMRCMSYNILADMYADTDTARNYLFAHCPPEALSLDYRKQLYLKEILGYNADLICFQEVDRKVFNDDLVPVLSSAGLGGVYNGKGVLSQLNEGLALFYKSSKFKLVNSHAIILAEALKTEPVLQKIFSKISENEKLTERILQRTTTLQVALLESIDVPNKRILIGNTHLYFHPESDNIRLLQAASFILCLEKILQGYQEEESFSTSLMLCGDFNSCPEFGVYRLMTEGCLSEDCDDWKSNPEEAVAGIPLSHTMSLASACGTPNYTNFTVGFNGCLDYIFYDKSSLSVTDIVPLPTHEQVIEKIALPNELFPSDHLALVCTLKWK